MGPGLMDREEVSAQTDALAAAADASMGPGLMDREEAGGTTPRPQEGTGFNGARPHGPGGGISVIALPPTSHPLQWGPASWTGRRERTALIFHDTATV